MRRLLPLLLVAATATAHATPTPVEAPIRMPGLWLMNTIPGGDAARTASFHICIGKITSDDVLAHPGSTLGNCRDQQWSKDAYYTYYRATCDVKGSTATVEGRFGGDFKYNFQGEVTTTYSPPIDGVAVTKTEIDGRRLSPCRGDLPEGKFLIKGQDGISNLNVSDPIRQPAR
jgi:hypothetical protein